MWLDVWILMVGMGIAASVGFISLECSSRQNDIPRYTRPELYAAVRSAAVAFLTFGVLLGRGLS